MSDPYQIVLNTCPNADTARTLAAHLVEQRLAACVNIISGIHSVYRWRGGIERGEEHLLLIKTRQSAYAALEQAIRAHHPYELPEIVAVPVSQGLPAYLEWIGENTGPQT